MASSSHTIKRSNELLNESDDDLQPDEKKPRATQEDADGLAQQLMSGLNVTEGVSHPCSTCPGRVSKEVIDDWRHWVCVGQDVQSLKTLQTCFNMYVKTGYGVTYESQKGTGVYVMMCTTCMSSYKATFDQVAKAATLADVATDVSNCATPQDFHLYKIIARLLCNELCLKLKEHDQ